ncbi:MAG: hypothetical protein K2O18_01380 [Oscillospiraceae bacterium]|nr:hypothetical protein [Oscillospiraceae bacterium]
MSGPIDAVAAQQLCVQILTALTPSENLRILDRAAERLSEKDAVLGHLRHCIALGGELREEPNRYDSLEKVCTAIIRRRTSRETVRKSEYGEALGVTNKMQRRRLEKGEASLTPEQIRRICAPFQDPVLRRFWENMLYALDPDVSTAGRGDGPENGSLHLLCSLLAPEQYRKLDPRTLDFLETPPAVPPARFGEQPDRLYPVINTLAGGVPVLIPDLAEQEIGVHMNTWYAWRRAWTEAEENGFAVVPAKRLKRVQMMILSVLFSLNYPESIVFLALAGYRFVPGEPDGMVTRHLRSPTQPPEELRRRLREGLYTGEWRQRSEE